MDGTVALILKLSVTRKKYQHELSSAKSHVFRIYFTNNLAESMVGCGRLWTVCAKSIIYCNEDYLMRFLSTK